MSDDQNVASAEAAAVSADASGDLLNAQQAENQPIEGGKEPEANADSEASTAPDEYEAFSVPEGVELNQDLLAQANPIFKELGLSQEQAQKLVDLESARVQAQVDQFNQQMNAWKEAAKNDKEIGGDNFDRSIASANQVLKSFEPAFIEELGAFGLLNHPEFIRGLARIGNQKFSEDTPGDGAPAAREKSRIERLYGTNP